MHKPTIPILKGFIIFRSSDGLYSKGGMEPEWAKKPKIWSGMGPLKNHLNQFIIPPAYRSEFVNARTSAYKDCKVYNVATGEEENFDIRQHILDGAKKYASDRHTKNPGYKVKET